MMDLLRYSPMRSSGEYLTGTGQAVACPQCPHSFRSVYLPQEGHLLSSDLISLALALEHGASAVGDEVVDGGG